MWIIGHTALGYFIARGANKAIKKEFRPSLIPLVFILANFPDFLHFWVLHMAFHNFVASIICACLLVMAIHRVFPLCRFEKVILFLVVIGHAIGDLLFSVYYPFIPLSFSRYDRFTFDTTTALIGETVIGTIFILVIILSHDLARLRDSVEDGVDRFFSNDTRPADLFDGRYIPGLVFILFMATVTLETGLYLLLSYSREQTTLPHMSLLAVMVVFVLIGFSIIIPSRSKKTR